MALANATNLFFCPPCLNPKQIMFHSNIRRRKVESDPRSFKSACQIRCSASTSQVSVSDQPKHERRSANYRPNIWSYDFLQSLKNDQADTVYKERAEILEQELRFVINNEDREPLNLLELIDDIQRLGLRHRFETDISQALEKFVSSEDSICGVSTENSLHAAALRFRLLRQHGYEISQDVFKAFKDHKGNFKESLCKDVKGMLSLYEASRLAFEGEDLMDEALMFTRMHLSELEGSIQEKGLSEQVTRALELPLHRRMLRLEARWYIEFYNKKADAKLTLLEFAKLDFNMVQSIHQRDLKEMLR